MNTVKIYKVTAMFTDKTCYNLNEVNDFIDSKKKEFNKVEIIDKVKVEEKDCGFANKIGYSDVYPFEIVKVNTDKMITVREMDAERITKPEFVVGGFAGHCTNNREIEYTYSSNKENSEIKIRKHKDGTWKDKNGNRYSLSVKPYKFHDYNF